MLPPHAVRVSYDWLVTNNLWKSTVAFFVALILGWTLGHRPWKRHRASQAHIEDLLNTNTPGGLAVIKDLLTSDDEQTEDDDNGSDMPVPGKRRKLHHGGGSDVRENVHVDISHMGPIHGGGK